MENVQSLHWQLSVLSKAIQYRNLSGAASHVGLSQPQLSRIVQRLEAELGVVLLDRSARRKSGWMPIAAKVAEAYLTHARRLEHALQAVADNSHARHLTLGTLEGLIPLATAFCEFLFKEAGLENIELNVHDLDELESHFAKDEFDLIFTFREPGKQKRKYSKNFGYQALEKTGSSKGIPAFSPYEYASQKQRQASKDQPVLLSNSLSVRRAWIENHSGHGVLPSEVRKRRGAESELPVLLLGSDLINPALWDRIDQFRL